MLPSMVGTMIKGSRIIVIDTRSITRSSSRSSNLPSSSYRCTTIQMMTIALPFFFFFVFRANNSNVFRLMLQREIL